VKVIGIDRILGIAVLASLLAVAGCGSDHHHGGGFVKVTPRPPSKTSPGSGLFAVDCKRSRAYIPLDTLNGSENGQVSVIDLSVNPDTTDPRVTVVALTHGPIPTGTALDSDHNLILVVSGGFVDVINESNNTLVSGSPFAIPGGGTVGGTGQILYNPTTKLAILNVASPATGFVTFDPVTHAFGTVIPANYAETFSLNSTTNVVMDSSDSSPFNTIDAIDITDGRACVLTDTNLTGDQDGASTDAATNITVISNEDGTATVLNLNGSAFNPAGVSTTPCTLDETNAPNSVLVSGLPGSTAGSAVNGTTHQAFLIEDGSNGVTLIQLPSSPVAGQIVAGNLGTPSISSIPTDPLDNTWGTQGDPYAVAVGECNNKGYAVDDTFKFLVQVDLPTLLSTPTNISTALPAGKCAGTTSTTFTCNNGAGTKFFPLPGVI
jgi:hypothetical protein